MTEITMPAWLDQLVPTERRDEGRQLLADLEAIEPLLERFVAHHAANHVAYREAERTIDEMVAAGDVPREYAVELVNGLGALISAVDRTGDLFCLLTNLGIDPDSVISDFFERGPA